MAHALDGTQLKIERAGIHLETFRREFARFLKRSDYRIIREPDPDGEGERARVSFHESPSAHLGIIVGDFANNLRSALDHLTWQLALLTTTAPPRNTEFPIFAKDGPNTQDSIEGKTRAIQNGARDIIKGLQPYHRRGGARRDDLWILHRLANTDKHRVLAVVRHAAILRGLLKGTSEGLEKMFTGPIEDGDVVPVTFDAPPFSELMEFQVELQIEPAFIVSFEEQQVGQTGMVQVAHLPRIYETVRNDVLPRFTGFFP
jgi:hypothetical protein